MTVDVSSLRLTDDRLAGVAAKVVAGARLDRDDALVAATSPDLLGVGRLANLVRERLHGNRTYYNVNRHLNPTNVCVASCALCAFYVPFRERDQGWTYSVDEAVAIAQQCPGLPYGIRVEVRPVAAECPVAAEARAEAQLAQV